MKFLIFLVFLSFFSNCSDNVTKADFLERQVIINSNAYNYRIYIPPNYQPNDKLPIMLFLHGSDERGDDNESQISGFKKIIEQNPNNFSFIIVFPQCRKGKIWAGEMAEQAIKALDQTVKEFNGDEYRLYLSGFSLGGYGAWQTALLYPNKFAAIVPISGRILPRLGKSSNEKSQISPQIISLAESENPYQSFAEKIGKTPVWAFHGKEDKVVPINQVRKMIETLKSNGNINVNFTEYENSGHVIIEKVFEEAKLFEWLENQKQSEN
jgi:predicted peptidase